MKVRRNFEVFHLEISGIEKTRGIKISVLLQNLFEPVSQSSVAFYKLIVKFVHLVQYHESLSYLRFLLDFLLSEKVRKII